MEKKTLTKSSSFNADNFYINYSNLNLDILLEKLKSQILYEKIVSRDIFLIYWSVSSYKFYLIPIMRYSLSSINIYKYFIKKVFRLNDKTNSLLNLLSNV